MRAAVTQWLKNRYRTERHRLAAPTNTTAIRCDRAFVPARSRLDYLKFRSDDASPCAPAVSDTNVAYRSSHRVRTAKRYLLRYVGLIVLYSGLGTAKEKWRLC
ncbi:hypothetical protein EVAR_90577_1 [Eumeta japonica]|uniref:Uncharacterized protein n=1 Tax=Eumeta variegata TaxID=151549 RepID=A0A4C1YRF6_EUMVA|nr:hypothetical protein EVAR_90577_1 [Eumeta japonica]